uniref:Uncharacterized protein n=1 Tax=Amphiprion ocellaris TaxID=80972 RepID=A0AAQ5ZSD2_AMPOC
MLGSVLLCCWSFSLLRLSSSLVHGNIQLDEAPATGRRPDTSYLSDMERGHAPDPALLPEDSVEDHFLLDGGSYDEFVVSMSCLHVLSSSLISVCRLHVSPLCVVSVYCLHVLSSCLVYMSRLHVLSPCLVSMSRLHVLSPCLVSMSRLHVSSVSRLR